MTRFLRAFQRTRRLQLFLAQDPRVKKAMGEVPLARALLTAELMAISGSGIRPDASAYPFLNAAVHCMKSNGTAAQGADICRMYESSEAAKEGILRELLSFSELLETPTRVAADAGLREVIRSTSDLVRQETRAGKWVG
jgi:hypothetical protein